MGFLCCAFLCFLFYVKSTSSASVISEEHRYLSDRRNADLAVIESLRPIKAGDYIMYWRPQKVGSSTLLSILMSYAYRYNFLPRRKSYGNAACAFLADCALQDPNQNLTTPQISYLKKLSKLKSRPSLKGRDQAKQEEFARRIPFKIILTHEMCNLNNDVIKRSIACLFNSAWEKEPASVAHTTNYSPVVREIFQVRDPIARAVSAYYFWGELYKLVKAKRKKSSSGKRLRTSDIETESSTARLHSHSTSNGNRKPKKQVSLLEDTNHRKLTVAEHKNEEDDEDEEATEAEEESQWHDWFLSLNTADYDRIEDFYHRHLQQADSVSSSPSPSSSGKVMLGSVSMNSPVEGGLFVYHGNERTAPSLSFAMNYARDLPLMAGMPGPSFTWSAFANSPGMAIERILYGLNSSDSSLRLPKGAYYPSFSGKPPAPSPDTTIPMMTIVLERLEESLIVLRHHLGWSLADVIYVKQRKSLSSHPKARDWPQDAVELLHHKLYHNGEYAVYNASLAALDERIRLLETEHRVNVTEEIRQFRVLRRRVSDVCLQDEYLLHYKRMMDAEKLPPHPSDNKLRDVEEKYAEQGHIYSFNREILCSFDVCGGCEAHAMLLSWQQGLSRDLDTALTLRDLPKKVRENNVNFAHCPSWT